MSSRRAVGKQRGSAEVVMSKKSEKALAKVRANLRTTLLVFAIGVIFLALGIVGLVLNQNAFSSYQSSLEAGTVLEVDGIITYAEKKTRSDDGKAMTVYDVKYRYEVDGKEYAGKRRVASEVQIGDPVSVEVYRAGNTYREPTIRTEGELRAANLYPIVALVLGAALAGMGIVVGVGDLKELKTLSKNKSLN